MASAQERVIENLRAQLGELRAENLDLLQSNGRLPVLIGKLLSVWNMQMN
jgi:hypothetical protein